MPDSLDSFDKKILAALQRDARLTNTEIAEQAHLSPSQCSRRRLRLEEDGIIAGYHARLDRERTGFGLVNMVSVTLATHDRENANRFSKLMDDCPQVLEAYALTGEMDYLLKVVTNDLKGLSSFVNEVLLAHESVQNVKTAVVLDILKDTQALPLG